jgi:cell division protein FtsI/penicillin-binding protein 2
MRRPAALAAALILLATGLVACSREPGPKDALNAFSEGWSKGSFDGVTLRDADGKPLAGPDAVKLLGDLSGDLVPTKAKLSPVGDPKESGDSATGQVKVEWTVAQGLVWTYETAVGLRKVDKKWQVVLAPKAVHPQLEAGRHFETQLLAADRGQILDGAGGAIVSARPVVTVGIEPQRVKNQASLIATLNAAFASVNVAVDLGDLPGRLAAANPDAFVEVVTLRRDVYDQIRSRIRDLDGTVFREGTLQLAPTRAFARALLGTVGDVQKEQIDKNPGKYLVGEQIGQSGLQETYDDFLRGVPGVQIVIPQPRSDTGTGEADLIVFRAEPKTGQALKTTLDQKVQNAADAALAGQPLRSALVAIRVSDGAILAAANGPDGGELNLAFEASVPPGSTFKMVTALGLLDNGSVNQETPVNCPKTFTVDGRAFNNAGNFELGTVPFHTDFAKSCNTAFASLAPKLGGDGLRKAAASLGIGTQWSPGAATFTGSVPANASNVEAAAAAFGQGQTLVSPLCLGAAAAAVARGTWLKPKLFTEAPPAAPLPQVTPGPGAAPAPNDGTALKAESVNALRAMMREVVTAGTATALADVPGQPVQVKTGTAEFDNNPANTHAWTIGWQGDVAFAVFVEKGGSSGDTAVPIVEKFLRGLA